MRRQSPYGGTRQTCIDDEELARRLQMEEQSMGASARNPVNYASAQEREDAALARQVANMDLKSPPTPQHPGDSKPPPGRGVRRGTSVDSHEFAGSSEAAAIAQRAEGSAKFYAPPRRLGGRRPHHGLNQSLQGGGGKRPPDQTSVAPENLGVRRSSSADDQLAYARRLQEEAFSNIRRSSAESGSSEESDLMLAIKMQEEMQGQGVARTSDGDEDSVGSDHLESSPWKKYSNTGTSTPKKDQDKDQALAEFMSLTGASFSDLSVDLINDIVGNNDKPGGAVGGGGRGRTGSSRGSSSRQSVEQLRNSARFRRVLEQGGTEQPNVPPAAAPQASLTRNPLNQASNTSNPVRSPKPRQTLTATRSQMPAASIPPPPHAAGGPPASIPPPEPIMLMKGMPSKAPGRIPAPASPTRQSQMPAHSDHYASPRVPMASLASRSEHRRIPDKKSKKKKKKKGFFGRLGRGSSDDDELNSEQTAHIPGDIPLPPPIPPANLGPTPPVSPVKVPAQMQRAMHPRTPTRAPQPSMRTIPVSPSTPTNRSMPLGGGGPSPRSRMVTIPAAPSLPRSSQRSICVVCSRTTGSFLSALGQKFHPECFRCAACRQLIDPYGQFKAREDAKGTKHPYHIKCHAEAFGMRCSVCRQSIPVSTDGTVAFVKHPFFDKELMCIKHADHPVRVCSGCKRFEPYDKPFVDLGDRNRCVCPACFKSVVVNDADVRPLWSMVISFLEHKLKLPIWKALRDIPVLLISSDTLRQQLAHCHHVHDGAKQLMCSGMCLTDNDPGARFAIMPSLSYDESAKSFRSFGRESSGFFEAPTIQDSQSMVNVFAISCMYGLPKDLTAGILAHEALHAWFLMHPKYNPHSPVPAEVEEGCAQLTSMLFLSDGLGPPVRHVDDADGPSDERIRQYLKFSIERDTSDMYGVSYRKAATAYRDIGMEALLSHVMHYRDFPQT